MEYKVSELAQYYAESFVEKEVDLKSYPVPSFNTDAYNEYEYLRLMQEINQSFDLVNDLHITERFLKGE